MSVTSFPFLDSPGAVGGDGDTDVLVRKWSAIRQAANVVAALAGVGADSFGAAARDYPATMRAAGGWRLALAAQGIDDLAAVMEPGLAALLSLHRRGADPLVAAQALWEEFAAARAAMFDLVPPPR